MFIYSFIRRYWLFTLLVFTVIGCSNQSSENNATKYLVEGEKHLTNLKMLTTAG